MKTVISMSASTPGTPDKAKVKAAFRKSVMDLDKAFTALLNNRKGLNAKYPAFAKNVDTAAKNAVDSIANKLAAALK